MWSRRRADRSVRVSQETSPGGAVLAYLELRGTADRAYYAASQLAEAKERLKAATAYAQAQIQEAQTGFSKLTDRKL